MADLWKEIIPSLLQTKDYLLNDSDEEKNYNPYIVNKALSTHIDCLFYVSEMNANWHLDKKLQYDYYFHSLKGYKRKFQKWFKNEEPEEIKLIMEFYNYSNLKAKQIFHLLSQEQIEIIKNKLDKGGKSK